MKDQAGTEPAQTFAQQEDRELIAACLEGDAGAWEALIVRYQRLIYSIPLKARLSTDDAADIFQSVCLKLYEKLATLREHEKIIAWLITTTTRETWRMAARARREGQSAASDTEDASEAVSQIPATGPLADEQRQALQQQQIVREGISALPDRCRDLITMLFYQKDDLSYADIAARMKMPVASVGPTRARCLEKLKKLLQGKI
ncbi:MAG TPA: sigma-70 family RNA polymerase sigma factor [Blastocatellia bacterium]|nr:sigma-70 family RNA polymerase sigma factor [Blastocatellia bacterium]